MKSPTRRRSLLVILVTVLAMVAVACGSEKETGGDLSVQEGDGSDVLGALRDTTTTAPPQVEGAEGDGGGAAITTPPPTAAATTAPPTTAVPTFQVKVLANSPYFDPVNTVVNKGTVVEFVNTDSVERDVWINNGSVWKSGMIPPGGKAQYKADRPGTFQLTENTRPFATGGQMKVQ